MSTSSVLKRLEDALRQEDVVFHTASHVLDCERVYRQYQRLFDECDYMFERHNVKVCVAVFRFNPLQKIASLHVRNILRLTDKHIYVNDTYHIVLFTFTNSKMAYQAIARIERNLLHAGLIQDKDAFTCVSMQRKLNNTMFGILEQCSRLVEISGHGIFIENS